MKKINRKFLPALKNLIEICADLKPHESVLIVSDYNTENIGSILYNLVEKISTSTEHIIIPPFTIHGEEPPIEVGDKMENYNVIFGLTKMSMAHTNARFIASKKGAKYLSLPDYNLDLLQSKALLANFKSLTKRSLLLKEILDKAKKITLTTKKGSHLELNIENRIANAAPGWCYQEGVIASPPDAETNIAVIENKSNGVVIVDGSIPCVEIGLLGADQKLVFENGCLVGVEGTKGDILKQIFNQCIDNEKARIIGEFGIGLNPFARLTGNMLEDEGTIGTVHIGLGSNSTIGGNNSVPFHLDFVIKKATVRVDDSIIINNGEILVAL